MALDWERKNRWLMQSACGKYRITAARDFSPARYLVWFGRQSIGPFYPSTEAATEAAEAHALHPAPG
jgi:hypothetical protein